jgi:polar amino acid transport system permease protein
MNALAALPDAARLPRVRRHHIGRWLAAAAVLALLALVVRAFALGQINWPVVAQFLTARSILTGLGFTLIMTVLAMALGLASGVLFAVMKMSPNPVLRGVAGFYIWMFRGTPLLLQLLLWFNLALIFPTLGIPGVASWRTVDLMTPFVATLLGLGLNQGAYTAEVVRAGILSIDLGQTEAAKAIGMTRLTLLRRIVLPQAMRVIIPPVGNEVVSMVKLTAMASVIQYPDILRSAQTVYYANGLVIELLLVASAWYLGVVTLLSLGQMVLEKRFARRQVRRTIAGAPAAAVAAKTEGAGA